MRVYPSTLPRAPTAHTRGRSVRATFFDRLCRCGYGLPKFRESITTDCNKARQRLTWLVNPVEQKNPFKTCGNPRELDIRRAVLRSTAWYGLLRSLVKAILITMALVVVVCMLCPKPLGIDPKQTTGNRLSRLGNIITRSLAQQHLRVLRQTVQVNQSVTAAVNWTSTALRNGPYTTRKTSILRPTSPDTDPVINSISPYKTTHNMNVSRVFLTEPPLRSRLHNTVKTVKAMVDRLEYFAEDKYLAQNASFFIPRPTVVNSFLPSLLIHPDACPDEGPFLLVTVPSAGNHFNERQAIRDTWASTVHGASWPRIGPLRQSVRVVFFLGVEEKTNTTMLKQESERYGDIVQADFKDSYRNLTLKMASVFHWSATYCRNARHVLKLDEDTFVNLPLLLDLLTLMSTNRSHVHYVLGSRHYVDQPVVVRSGKWKVETDAYPLSVFPRYVIGPSYVVSGDAVDDLVRGYQHMPSVSAEDAHFTGILAKTMSVRRIHSPNFGGVIDQNRCDLLKGTHLSQTNFKPFSALYDTWIRVNTGVCA
ncbi:hypothetical protein BaRGS_00002247 [Batillaria attramentaria]|uniref:Hexosyltransferase n=1 Tax=Batillaria attramentaria TaxID=370345 RepID=A0ABD0M664_9CAEN